jgi:sulfoxide reductase heme-binding subunit YedZ
MRIPVYPLLDHSGRFSPFKALVFVLLFVPGVWIANDFVHGNLGPRPLNEAVHQIGLWGIRLLFLSLAMTPLRQLWRWQDLANIRRMIGIAAFAYLAAHLVLYAADEAFRLGKVVNEIILRFYLTIGFVALVGLAALAITSTDGMTRRLGGRAWRRLHQTIYVVSILAIVHFFLQSKLDVYEPTVMAGLFLWLMGFRFVAWSGKVVRRTPTATAFVLVIVAAALTAGGEAIYFWATMGIDPLMVLEASLMFDIGLRPCWIVFAITLGVAVVTAVRGLIPSFAKAKPRVSSAVRAG